MKNSYSLESKRALVCGASQGIGEAVAFQLAQLGAQVTVAARRQDKLEQLVSQLPHGERKHQYVALDFSDAQQAELKLKKEMDALGGGWHILVNNAGGPAPGEAQAAKAEDFLPALNIHLFTNLKLCQLLLPYMRSQHYGRIINIISTSVKEPIPGLGVSNTIRSAVASFSKTLSREVAADQITVNNVLPGYTDTSRLGAIFKARASKLGISEEEAKQQAINEVPMKRLADASEIAAAVGFIASPAASYVNGINLPVDGGRTRSL